MEFHNRTSLDSGRLYALLVRHSCPYRHDRLIVRFRFSRAADFSGACYYASNRIFVNLGRHLRFPYTLATHLARAHSRDNVWWRELYYLTLHDGYQLGLFIYLHELYHYLVKQAGRSVRQKEAMCDRFAARVLVDQFGCPVRDSEGRMVPRATWDFRDLHAFVAAAPREPVTAPMPEVAARPPIPVRIRGR